MKKLMCLALGVSLLGAMIVVAGCGGGGGLGTILGAAFVIAIVASTGGAGGAGAVPFAASLRERPAIRGTISLTTSNLHFRITPYLNGLKGESQFVDVATSPTDASVLVGTGSINVNDNSNYMVELVSGEDSNAVPVLKSMIVDTNTGDTETLSATVNALSTARTLVYNQWLDNNPISGSYENFSNNLTAANNTSIAAIGQAIENDIYGDSSVTLTDYNDEAETAANSVANVMNPSMFAGWWLLDPSNSDEYAATRATGTHSLDKSSMFGFVGGSFEIQSSGSLMLWLDNSDANQSVDAYATMTSTTAMTYAAYNRHTRAVEETGTGVKVSNAAACAGTWKGTAQNGTTQDQITVVIGSDGLIQSFSGDTADALPAFTAGNGFVVSESGKVAGYANFSDQYQTKARFFGTISGTTFTGTIESESTAPEANTPNGTITMTKQ